MSLWNAFAAEDDGYDRTATEAEAHREWHRNTGEKYGCPWDACEPPEPEHCPVPGCYRYLEDDGTCRDQDEPEHIAGAARRMDEILARRAEHEKAEAARAPEPDPWF